MGLLRSVDSIPRKPVEDETHLLDRPSPPSCYWELSMDSYDQLAQLEMSVRLCMDPASAPRRRLSSAGKEPSVY